MQCARSATIWTSSRPRTPYFVILWALLLFDNGYFECFFYIRDMAYLLAPDLPSHGEAPEVDHIALHTFPTKHVAK